MYTNILNIKFLSNDGYMNKATSKQPLKFNSMKMLSNTEAE